MSFVHLHNHTMFSPLDGAQRLDSMCARAAELGQTAMAITDHGSLAGAWKFTRAAQAAGIKPIIGIEVYLSIGPRFERNSEVVDRNDDTTADADDGKGETKEKRYEHLTLIARNETGWKNLLAIHNKAEESYWYKPRCMPAGHKIYTADGVKNIEDIQVGDMVLTHKGRFRRVTELMVNQHDGLLYGVSLNGRYGNETWLTGEHPVLIRSYDGSVDWVEAKDIVGGLRNTQRTTQNWNSYVCLPKLAPDTGLHQLATDEIIGDIWRRNGDKVTKAIPRQTIGDTYAHSELPAAIALDYDFGRFVGLYLAEGAVGRNQEINFSFHKEETHLSDFIAKMSEVLVNKLPVVDLRLDRPDYRGMTLRLHSAPLALLMSRLFGSGAKNKHLPSFALSSNPAFIRGIYDGVLEGDGNRGGGAQRLRQTSEALAWQMRLLGASVSESFASVKKHHDGDPNHAPMYWSNFTDPDAVKHRKTLADEQYVYRPVSEVKTREYSGLVYNFEVEEDHSYVSDFAMHNCDYELLKEHGEGLIVLTGCLAGPVAGPLSRGAVAEKAGDGAKAAEFEAEARANLDRLIDCVGKENVYLEIMYHGIDAEDSILKPIGKVSREYGIPMVATNDCHYELEGDAGHHAGFLAVGSKKGLDDPARFKFNGEGYFIKSEQEMLDIKPGSRSWANAVAMSQVIADRCDDQVIPEPHQRLPKYPLPGGFEDSGAYLKRLVKDGAVRRYGSPLPQEVKDRLSTELGVIGRMGFPDYFLIVWDVINWCRSDAPVEFDNPDAPRKKPILVGPGRGSAAGSCVSYCLEIVGIDPLANNLLFERFLEEGRAGMPDIDVDFEKLRRDEVFAYLAYRWGQGNVARIGTFGMALSKAAIKDAARILKPSGPSAEAVAAAEKLFAEGRKAEGGALLKRAAKEASDRAAHIMRLGNQLSDLVPASGEKAYNFDQLADTKDQAGQAFRDLVEESGQDAQDIVAMARAFEGVIKNESIHACGFVVSPEPLDELVPLRWASHAEGADPSAPRVICWDGPQVEDYGFLKMDVLGLMNLDIVSQALENIEMTTGEHLTMDTLPHPDTQGDPKVDAAYELIAAGRTASVFQMESPGMIKVAQDVVPERLTDISAIVALFRPGPLAAKVPDLYAARKNGREPVDYNQFTSDRTEQEWIATVLDDTYALFVFQEQLMKLGTVIAGFDAKQRSTLRKAVGKKKKSEMDKVGQMLLEGAEQEFYDEDGTLISPVFSKKTAAHMFELMQGSASYLFNASHSAAYALLAFITAYLKANWPTEYGAAILAVTDMGKDDKRLAALSALREDGIEVLPPDVNLSLAKTAPIEGSVRMGMTEVKEVGSAGVHIVAEREANGPFKGLHDLLSRVTVPGKNGAAPTKLPVGAVQGLIEAGALDSFGPRLGLLMTVRAAHKADLAPVDAEWSDVEESTRQRLRLGVSLGTHPLQSLKAELNQWRAPRGGTKPTPLHRIPDEDGQSTLTVGVISFWEEKGYSGGRRANFTLESTRVTIRGVIWDRALSGLRTRNAVPKIGDIVAVSGRVNVRVTALGDDESETQDTITTKELSVNELWPIATVTPPEIREPAAVIDFAAKYRQLRGDGPAPDQPQEPAEGSGEDADAATVTSIEEKRAQNRWFAVQLSHRSDNLSTSTLLDGDPEVRKAFTGVGWPDKVSPGTIYRIASPVGRATVLFPTRSMPGEKLLEVARGIEDDDPRWVKVTDGSFTWYLLDQASEAAGAEGIAA